MTDHGFGRHLCFAHFAVCKFNALSSSGRKIKTDLTPFIVIICISVKNYLVYFWVDEEEKKVQVFGIIYGHREQRHQLSNMDMN